MPVYPITLSESLYDQAQKYAAKNDISVAEFIRICMRDGLANPSTPELFAGLFKSVNGVQKLCLKLNDVQREYSKTFTAIEGVLRTTQRALLTLAKEVAVLKRGRGRA